MVRYWCSNTEPKPSKSSITKINSKEKSDWKFYPNDLVMKNLKPDPVPKHYKMIYRSSIETITNMGILVNGTAVLGFPTFLFTTSSDLTEMASLESGLGVFALFSYVAILYVAALQVPLRMYYSSENKDFLVKMPHLIPYQTRTLTMQSGTVAPPKSSRWKPWVSFQYTHIPSNTKLILLKDSFEIPMYYWKLLSG